MIGSSSYLIPDTRGRIERSQLLGPVTVPLDGYFWTVVVLVSRHDIADFRHSCNCAERQGQTVM